MDPKESKCEDSKKNLGEYIKIFPEAKKLYKAKQYKSALEKYQYCLSLIESSDLIDKQCQSHFFIGQCLLNLNAINESDDHFNQCEKYIAQVNQDNFPYYKMKSKLSANLILLKYAIQDNKTATSYAKIIINDFETYTFNNKLLAFPFFLKQLLFSMKTSKKLVSFINDYQSAKNEIMFNDEINLCPSLKSSFLNLMNNTTKTLLLMKNDAMFYNVKYGFKANHPLLAFFEKNGELLKENNAAKIKSTLDQYLKTQKIKLDMNTNDLLLEKKTRLDNFNEFFNVLSGSFCLIFKKDFSSGTKLQIKSNGIDSVSPPKFHSPVTKDTKNKGLSFSTKSQKTPIDHTAIENIKPGSASIKTINANRKQKIQEDSENYTKGDNESTITLISANDNNGPEDILNNISLNTQLESPSINNDIIKAEDKPSHGFHKRMSVPLNLYTNHKKKEKDKIPEETNDYDHSRIENISTINDPSFANERKRNIFLFQTIIDEITKSKKVRDCDIIPTKITNCVKNYSMSSQQGHHQTFGESISVNQDVCFAYEGFLLLYNLFFFGVCDGHGEYGHLVSQHAKTYLPSNIQYIEFDNNFLRKNKNVQNSINSLYSLNEKSAVKDINIIKYFYDKFGMNYGDMSLHKKNFNDVNSILKEAFRQTHDDLMKRDFDCNTSGSTVCTVLLSGKSLFCANLGDSRTILCSCDKYNGKWTAAQLTKDHKPTDLKEKNRIIMSKGKVKRCQNEEHTKEIGPYRVWHSEESKGVGLAMSRSLGDKLSKEIGVIAEPDIYEYCLNSNDKFIIIATDGIWEYISNEDAMNIVKLIYLDTNLSTDACAALTKEATQRWKKKNGSSIDDITCVIIFLQVDE